MRLIGKARSATPLAVLMAVVATLLVSGGTYAAAATLITGKQVKDNSLTSRDVKNNSLTSRDVKSRSLHGNDIRNGTLTAKLFKRGTLLRGLKGATGGRGGTGATGARGASGARGEPGPQGEKGVHGPSGVTEVRVVTTAGNPGAYLALARCPAGSQAISGGGDAPAPDTLRHSGPVLSDDGKPVGWKVEANDRTPTAFALCAPAA
jgi:hypothetical protein